MVGTVIDDYEFASGTGPVPHRRRVQWERVIPRSAVRPSYALQDVRPLFPVHAADGEIRGNGSRAESG